MAVPNPNDAIIAEFVRVWNAAANAGEVGEYFLVSKETARIMAKNLRAMGHDLKVIPQGRPQVQWAKACAERAKQGRQRKQVSEGNESVAHLLPFKKRKKGRSKLAPRKKNP